MQVGLGITVVINGWLVQMCHSCQDEAAQWQELHKHETMQDGLLKKRKAKSDFMKTKHTPPPTLSFKQNE